METRARRLAAAAVLCGALGCGTDSGQAASTATSASSTASGGQSVTGTVDAGTSDADGDCEVPLQVYGRDMSGIYENVSVLQGGIGVLDAIVEVNGERLSHPPGYYDATYYGGQLDQAVSIGGSVVLEVVHGRCSVVAVGKVPESPFMTAPVEGATFAHGDSINVTWTSSTNPDHFSVNFQWPCGSDCGAGMSFPADGTARQLTVPLPSVPFQGTELMVSVFSYNDGEFFGDDYLAYPSYPGMHIRGEWNRATVSVK